MILGFMQAICDAEGIGLHGYELEFTKGIAMRFPEKDLLTIAYSPKLEGWEQIATIAHELGRHILGHLDDDVMEGENLNDNNPIKERREREAQVFAATFKAMALYDYYKSKLQTT